MLSTVRRNVTGPWLACLSCRTNSSNELKELGVALAKMYSGG